MRKLTAIVTLVVMLGAGASFATQTRVLTLGEVGGVVHDESNVSTWPQVIRMYPNLGLAEVMGGTFHTSGWHCTMDGSSYTLGAYWTTQQWMNAWLPAYFGGGVDQKLTILYGRELAEMPFGVSFSLYGNSHEKAGTDKTAHSAMGMKIGVGVTLMEALETGLTFGTLSFEGKDAAGVTNHENEGGTQIALNARYWMEHDDMSLIPHFMFETNSGGMNAGSGGAMTTDDMTTIELGLGHSMMLGEAGMYGDIGIALVSGDSVVTPAGGSATTIERTNNSMPYFKGGMEMPMSERFTFRVGGVKVWNGKGWKSGSEEETWGMVQTKMYMGFAYNREHFMLDANMDPGFFTRGPYLISGAGGALATQVSLKYTW
jgi:hypothetical protein